MEMQTVTAYPVVHDVPALMAFLQRVFGATEKFRVVGSSGAYHAEAVSYTHLTLPTILRV